MYVMPAIITFEGFVFEDVALCMCHFNKIKELFTHRQLNTINNTFEYSGDGSSSGLNHVI